MLYWQFLDRHLTLGPPSRPPLSMVPGRSIQIPRTFAIIVNIGIIVISLHVLLLLVNVAILNNLIIIMNTVTLIYVGHCKTKGLP